MSARRGLAIRVCASVLALGCAGMPASRPAQITVEVLRGMRVPTAPIQVVPRVEVLLDARASMAQEVGSTTRIDAARAGVEQLLAVLPEGSEVSLHVLGHRDRTPCASAERAAGPLPVAAPRLGAALGDVEARGDGSLAESLDVIVEEVASDPVAETSRIVVFTDLDTTCDVSLCDAARSALEAGVWVDWVVLGDAPAPACLEPRGIAATRPGALAEQMRGVTPTFHVVAGASPNPEAVPAAARGVAGDAAVAVAPGEVTIWIGLSPPEPVGPVTLRSGERIHVRLLEFPMTDPPQRRWSIERQGESFDDAFPTRAEVEG